MKTGLFGGAFNPIHNGHLQVARTAIENEKLDRLIFIPTGNAPHKREGEVSREDRLKMIECIVKNEEKMFVSDYELKRDEISYSADTIEYFKKLYPEDELYFIIGDDSYNNFESWHEPQRILDASTVLVFPREGGVVYPPFKEVKMEKIKISSKDIRQRIKNGKDCKKLLPKEVLDYIIKGELYTR